MEKNQLLEQVMHAIAGLPRKQRETVTLFYINGYSIKDIAAMQEALPPYRQQHVPKNTEALRAGFEAAPTGLAPAWSDA